MYRLLLLLVLATLAFVQNHSGQRLINGLPFDRVSGEPKQE